MRLLALFAAIVATAGCLAPTSSAQKLTDNAMDMNTAARFGRMDIAVGYVAADARDTFTRAHAGWGKNVRIVDLEFTGFQLKESDDADVFMNVAWQSPADPSLRETRVVQHWHRSKGTWSVASETAEGDGGLLGEKPKARPAPLPGAVGADGLPPSLPTVQVVPHPNRYQTRVIYDD